MSSNGVLKNKDGMFSGGIGSVNIYQKRGVTTLTNAV